MRSVNTHEAKTHLSQLLAAVEEQGEVISICRNGRAIAELRPIQQPAVSDPLRPSRALAAVRIAYDPTEPLTDAEWPEPEA
jgi:antitoxin (DNA-binding transcriptional repressor) of toxin-antitoxin stability system